VIGFEMAFGAALVIGSQPRLFRALAIVAFSLFSLVNVNAVADGLSTCDCFGPLAASPKWVLALDLALLAGLVAFAPKRSGGRLVVSL
jgi:uncharacterized membrane protein YphA (DoxX/SURF4 family)